MNNKKGFTLIEMLVVVGMIGVLAAAVLTALGPSRQKARDARITSNVNQSISLIESTFNGTTYDMSRVANSYLSLFTDTGNMGGQLSYSISGTQYIVFSRLASDQSKYYCADSNGARIVLASGPSASAVSCQ